MNQQHDTPEARIAALLASHGIHGFVDAEGTPSIMVLHWSQNPPSDGFEDPTGGHCYLPGEILWETVEVTEGSRIHSILAADYDSPNGFAIAVSQIIRGIAGWNPSV